MDINMNTVKLQINTTVFAYFDKNTQKVEYKVYPRKEAWRASDDEICVDDDFPIDMELPYLNELEMRQKAVDTLRAKQQKAYAEAEREHQRLQKKIDELLLLTYDNP